MAPNPSSGVLEGPYRRGMPALAIFGFLSVTATATLFAFITYRIFMWRRYYRSFIGRNQYVLLVYSLTVADFLQGFAFTISFHWLYTGRIDSNSNWCFAQGFLAHLGDVSSALFVFGIAVHTWWQLMMLRPIKTSHVLWAIAGIWTFATILTVITPIIRGKSCMAQSGGWCWIQQKYEQERLWTHYFWIFAVEFTCILLYLHCWWFLSQHSRRVHQIRLRSPANPASNKKLARTISTASYIMLLYPFIYTMFTLPLAAGCMAVMAHDEIPQSYWVLAGCFITSCGWLDTLVYAFTRRALLRGELNETEGHGQSNPNKRTSKSLSGSNSEQSKSQSSDTNVLVGLDLGKAEHAYIASYKRL